MNETEQERAFSAIVDRLAVLIQDSKIHTRRGPAVSKPLLLTAPNPSPDSWPTNLAAGNIDSAKVKQPDRLAESTPELAKKLEMPTTIELRLSTAPATMRSP